MGCPFADEMVLSGSGIKKAIQIPEGGGLHHHCERRAA
jgi:hypothetical protein